MKLKAASHIHTTFFIFVFIRVWIKHIGIFGIKGIHVNMRSAFSKREQYK